MLQAPPAADPDLFSAYLARFAPLLGDRRTARTLHAILWGILTVGALLCQRIATRAAPLAHGQYGSQRVRRLLTGLTTTRSHLDAAHLTAQLRATTVARFATTPPAELWLILDGSDIRKPYARTLPYLDKVRDLHGQVVPGYPTLNVLAVSPGQRGLLYHHLYSQHEPGFLSASVEVQRALTTTSAALAPLKPTTAVTWLLDREFDDIAVWRTIWQQQEHLVGRVKHRERLIRYHTASRWQDGTIHTASQHLHRLATVETVLEVRLRGQKHPKRQPVTVDLSVCPMEVRYETSGRQEAASGQYVRQRLWLVEVRLRDCDWEPWLLVTDWPVRSAAAAQRIFQMYRQRWAVEDCFKFIKTAVGWESGQVADRGGLRTLLALAWVAAGFLYELGVSLEWEGVRLLARLGGWEERADRPPGKLVLQRGLARLLDMLVTEGQLRAYLGEHGALPPQIAALLGGWRPPPEL